MAVQLCVCVCQVTEQLYLSAPITMANNIYSPDSKKSVQTSSKKQEGRDWTSEIELFVAGLLHPYFRMEEQPQQLACGFYVLEYHLNQRGWKDLLVSKVTMTSVIGPTKDKSVCFLVVWLSPLILE